MERRKARRLARRPDRVRVEVDGSSPESTENPFKNQTNKTDRLTPPGECVIGETLTPRTAGGVESGSVMGRSARRRLARIFVERAAWLRPADRALVEACHGEGLSVAAFVRRCVVRGVDPLPGRTLEAGTLAETTDTLVRVVRRRLRRVERRLASDRCAFVIARGSSWPSTRRRVAVTCVVQGCSMREAVTELGLSLHTVRRHLHAVEALYAEHAESMRRAREASRRAAAERDGEARWIG